MYYDIALVKLKQPFTEEYFATGAAVPIGLPESNYNEIGKFAFVAGYGVVYQQSLHTNGDGPEPYTQCAPGSVWDGEKFKHWEEDRNGWYIKSTFWF